ncbi:MAG: ATP-binding protein [Thermoplasmatales archaeon]|nr:ATP-binding protein [Thermoplasmatales archaeon]
MKSKLFTFAISLSVLDHLGRNLYRSIATVLGEAISNSWDADADNVWIHIDRNTNSFFIKDDGDGMTSDDFQDKFLKIGYSKRKTGKSRSSRGRPYIGRKGIGKLALLSCADKVTIISKVKGGDYIGGVIDNSGLDDAIKEDLIPSEYELGKFDLNLLADYMKNHEKGTIIYFENMKEGIKNRLDFLRKIIALSFRFSLLDKSFNIFLDGKKVTLDDLDELAHKTEFLWNINGLNDPFIKEKLTELKEKEKTVSMDGKVEGFIASVEKPKDLKIYTTDERVGVDLFVNGRLREQNILRHIPTARVVESYLYGQIHFNSLDDDKDRFATGREGIVAEDDKFKDFLENLKQVIAIILSDWDVWRRKHREEGDSENKSITKKDRKSSELFNAVSEEYEIPKDTENLENKKKVDKWVDDLSGDATYNFGSYAECFISENLIRKHIQEKNIQLSTEAKSEISLRKTNETQNKNKGNISIDIRKTPNDSSYLSMEHLSNLVDKRNPIKEACLSRDANEYKPIRDALMHTALLTNEAKQKLTTVYENIKGRVKTLLFGR